jgi:hypothetical protein
MSLDLFQLLPAVYKIRDAQLAAAKPLLTSAEAAEQAALRAQPTPLAADDQARLDELDAKASRGPLQSLLMVIGEQVEAVSYDLDRLYPVHWRSHRLSIDPRRRRRRRRSTRGSGRHDLDASAQGHDSRP